LLRPPSKEPEYGQPPRPPRPPLRPRHKYLEFLKSLIKQERYDEIMALRTALSGLGLKIEVEPPPLIIDASAAPELERLGEDERLNK
jgi:hypothetical protein